VYRDVDRSQAERVCTAALEKPDRFAAHRFLTQVLPQLDDALVGIHNQGLLSTHELRVGVPERDDWADATGGRPRRSARTIPARSSAASTTRSSG
jgi:hypothetical protein